MGEGNYLSMTPNFFCGLGLDMQSTYNDGRTKQELDVVGFKKDQYLILVLMNESLKEPMVSYIGRRTITRYKPPDSPAGTRP